MLPTGIVVAALAIDPALAARRACHDVTNDAGEHPIPIVGTTIAVYGRALVAAIAALWAPDVIASGALHHPILAIIAKWLAAIFAALARVAIVAYQSALAKARGRGAAAIRGRPNHDRVCRATCRMPAADHGASIATRHRWKMRGTVACDAVRDVDDTPSGRLQLEHVRLAEPASDERERMERPGQQTGHTARDVWAGERQRADRRWHGECDAIINLGALGNRDRREARVCSQGHEGRRRDACEADQTELLQVPGGEAE